MHPVKQCKVWACLVGFFNQLVRWKWVVLGPVKVNQVIVMDGFQKKVLYIYIYICATSLAFYEPIRNSDKTFTGGVLFKERQRFDCCLGPVNLSSVAVMKPFTFSPKGGKWGGDALVNEVCYYAKRDIAAGEELLCFDGIWVDRELPENPLQPTTAPNSEVAMGCWKSKDFLWQDMVEFTWYPWCNCCTTNTTAAAIILCCRRMVLEGLWNARDHEFHDIDNSNYHDHRVTTIHIVSDDSQMLAI